MGPIERLQISQVGKRRHADTHLRTTDLRTHPIDRLKQRLAIGAPP